MKERKKLEEGRKVVMEREKKFPTMKEVEEWESEMGERKGVLWKVYFIFLDYFLKNVEKDIVVAEYDYFGAPGTDDLSFKAGDVLQVFTRDTSGWWKSENPPGRIGWFDVLLLFFF